MTRGTIASSARSARAISARAPAGARAAKSHPCTHGLAVLFAVAILSLLGSLATPAPAVADWLTRVLRQAGDAGGTAARTAAAGLDGAVAHVRTIPAAPRAVALAAHAGDGGHWTFANRTGERFTVGTPEEMKRVASVLAPESDEDARLTLHVTEDTIFRQRERLAELPKGAGVSMVVGAESFPLIRRSDAGTQRLYAQVRPSIVVEIADRALFDETAWQLARPLNAARLRVLSLEPDGPATLPARPRLDKESKRPEVDLVDPYKLGDALASIRGQTALMTGRIDGKFLHYLPDSGTERSVLMADVQRAAEAADVNLVLLQSGAPRQPGARNWLWQRVAVEGLEAAVTKPRLADFLEAVAAGRGRLAISAEPAGPERVKLIARLAGADAAPTSGGLADWLRELAGSVTGTVVTSAVEVHMATGARQRELDARLVPFLPAVYPILYLGALVVGLMGLRVAYGWWGRLWPAEQRNDYAGVIGYQAARVVRLLLFTVLFLPLAALPAFVVTLLLQGLAIVTAPVRLLRRLLGRPAGTAGAG